VSDDRSRTIVGFIGLGSQGAPIARRIVLGGYPLVLWARRAASLEPFADTAAESAASIAELGERCDHVGICVVNDADTREVCDALIPGMRAGSRIAIHSTILPETVRDLAKQAEANGIVLLDAPVSGGQPAAEAGTLTLMIGGDQATLAAARPVFETFGKLIVLLGDVGAGQHAKLINNTLLAANMAIARHGMETGGKLGLDADALVELITHSSGRSMGFEVYGRMKRNLATFKHGGALLDKDVRLLGQLMGEDADYAAMRDLSLPFLGLIAAS
jgi:3-hydroxyisobutyrate dehydrogenase